MRTSSRICIIILLLPLFLNAQQKKLTLPEIALAKNNPLLRATYSEMTWLSDKKFALLDIAADSKLLTVNSVDNAESIHRLSLETLNRQWEALDFERMDNFPKLRWLNEKSLLFIQEDMFYQYKWQNDRLERLYQFSGPHDNEDYCSENGILAFTSKNNIYLIREDEAIPVTDEQNPAIVSGQAVHRSEFGIRKGTFWSPKGRYLAFYQKNESMVSDYPYVDFTTRPASGKPAKYPMAGQANHIVRIGVYDTKNKQTVWLETGQPADQYLTNITWTPDEKHIYVAHINRDQNHLRMIKYEAKNGRQLALLFEEREEKYLDPQTGPKFLKKDDRLFVWLSRRDGWNHAYLYNNKGEMLRQLSSGDWEVKEFLGADKDGKTIYLLANAGGATNFEMIILDVESATLTRPPMPEAGTHEIHLSPDGKYYLDQFSSIKTAATTALYQSPSTLIRILKQSGNPLADYQIGETKIMTVDLPEGERLYSRIIFPPDFQSNTRYPLILYVYGGPHSQQVKNTWLASESSWTLFLQYLASQGNIVFTVDNRGTNYRGRDFEQATFRQLGSIEIEDQIYALKKLRKTSFVDTNRVGVLGWSYGGFMATSLMVRRPELFKAGVAGAPVIDWKLYESVYTERYMDHPDDNAAGYQAANTIEYVDALTGKLLMIHGSSDPVVMWQHSMQFMKAAVDAGKHPDYAIYPGHLHGITGKDRQHLFKKISDFFRNNL